MKKLTQLLFAVAATLLFATSASAHHFQSVHTVSAVRAFTFSSPVYARAEAYFSYTPFNLVALPPVATVAYAPTVTYQAPQVTFTAPPPCVNTVQAAPVDPVVTYSAPAYVAPTYTYSLFQANPTYTVTSFGRDFGVHRFRSVRVAGVDRVVRVERIVERPVRFDRVRVDRVRVDRVREVRRVERVRSVTRIRR